MSKKADATIVSDLFRNWPGLVISVVALGVVFYLAGLSDLKKALWLADYRYFPPAIAIFLLSILARTFAWRILLQERASVRRVFVTLNEGYLLNNFLPFRLGEVGRGFLLSRTTDLGFWQVISTILIERAFDVILMVGILLGTLPYVIGADWARTTALWVGGIVVLMMVLLHLLARYRERSLRRFEKLRTRVGVLKRIRLTQIEPFINGLAALTDLKRFFGALAWLMLAWSMVIAQYYLILLAFVPDASLLWAAFGLGVVGLGVAIPSAPGSIGVVQATLVGVFSLFSIDPAVALAYSLAVHVVYFTVTSSLGIIGLTMDGKSLVGIYFEIKEKTSNLKNPREK